MPLKTLADDPPSLNLTPMIDVLFQLILFFMVGARFTQSEQQIDLKVPQVGHAASASATPRVINVYADGRMTLDEAAVGGLAELTRRLAQARTEGPAVQVLVRGEASGPYQRIAEVLSACRQAGIGQLGLSVSPVSAVRSDAAQAAPGVP